MRKRKSNCQEHSRDYSFRNINNELNGGVWLSKNDFTAWLKENNVKRLTLFNSDTR